MGVEYGCIFNKSNNGYRLSGHQWSQQRLLLPVPPKKKPGKMPEWATKTHVSGKALWVYTALTPGPSPTCKALLDFSVRGCTLILGNKTLCRSCHQK